MDIKDQELVQVMNKRKQVASVLNVVTKELSDEMVFAQLEGDDRRIEQVEDTIYATIRESLTARDEPA